MKQVAKRDEICPGVRHHHLNKDVESNFGVIPNIPKDQLIEITEDDFFVMLAEDEL